MKNTSNLELLKQVWGHLDQKGKLFVFLFFSLINAFTEAINIGLLIPFLKIIENPEILNDYYSFKIFFNTFSFITDPRVFILIFFTVFLLFSLVFRVFINWYTLKISYSISEKFAAKIYDQVLSRSFLDHINQNTSKSITDVTFRVNATTSVLMAYVIIFNNLILSLIIFSTLLLIDIKIIGFVILSIGAIYVITTFSLRSRFNKNSKIISENHTSLMKTLQESLGGIKEVIFTSTQAFYVKEYNKNFSRLNNSLIFNNFYAQSPKIVIETLSILILLGFYYYLFLQGETIIELIGLIGILAFGAQKLLPSFQVIYQNWTNITTNKHLVLEIINILNHRGKKYLKQEKLKFKNDISLKLMSFGYEKEKIIENINLYISKGDKIGIIGKSGSGKSTLINLLAGLITEFRGELKVDGNIIDKKNINSWREKIAYVPQNIFLFDESLKSNITFGVKSDIDLNKILTKVKLDSFINGRDINEIYVGERSSKISGGEKQRIALARALFKEVPIIIFDEATNALDKKTEKEILEIIYKLNNKTIIIITHDFKNLYGCNKVFELKKKKLKRIES